MSEESDAAPPIKVVVPCMDETTPYVHKRVHEEIMSDMKRAPTLADLLIGTCACCGGAIYRRPSGGVDNKHKRARLEKALEDACWDIRLIRSNPPMTLGPAPARPWWRWW